MTKSELRQRLREQRDSFSADERKANDKAIRDRLFSTEAYQKCDMIFPYVSFRSEVETGGIIRQSLIDNKRVFLPRVNGKAMEFYEIYDLKELQVNHYGIPEPPEKLWNRFSGSTGSVQDRVRIADVEVRRRPKTKDNRQQRLMLLPGLAFDAYGNRIGYGAGYYDRFLTEYAGVDFCKIALAYDFQVVDEIPTDIHDIRMDAVLTPSGLIRCIQRC